MSREHTKTNAPPTEEPQIWCKGKFGRAHVPEMRVGHHFSAMFEKYPCRTVDRNAPYWTDSDSEFEDGTRWVCYHEEFCSGCGEILTPWGVERGRCPEYIKMYSSVSL